MDRMEQIRTYTVQELVGELKRRKDELDAALSAFAGPGVAPSRMSEAKTKYWAEWHVFKAAHPEASLDQWRRSQKRTKK